MKSGAEKETNLYLRKDVESGSEEDEWDDSKLIKAYDKAIHKAKRQILKKLRLEMDLTNEEVKGVLSDSTSSSVKEERKKKNKRKKKKNPEGKNNDWKVGDACRAVYSDDREEYEANILEMLNGKWCRVKFVGYGNEQEVFLKELTPSLGKNVVQQQIETAQLENELKLEEGSDNAPSPQPDEEVPHGQHATGMPFPKFCFQRNPMFHRNHALPPPPPPPPMFGPASFHKLFNSTNGPTHPPLSRDEAHNAMMYSWYMCGYYTGYYQRELKDA